jgi:hypothetical protein
MLRGDRSQPRTGGVNEQGGCVIRLLSALLPGSSLPDGMRVPSARKCSFTLVDCFPKSKGLTAPRIGATTAIVAESAVVGDQVEANLGSALVAFAALALPAFGERAVEAAAATRTAIG